jgi:effector-binding domain-containing protein
MHEVRIEQATPRPLAVVRRRAAQSDLSRVVPEACGVVWNAVKARGLAGAGRHVAIYLNGEIDVEVGVEMPAPFAGGGDLVCSATPAGPVATTVHFGPYNRLCDAHQAIRDWCAAHGHTFAGPNWEIYGHWEDAWNNDPSLIRTDVFYLLKADGSPPTVPG